MKACIFFSFCAPLLCQAMQKHSPRELAINGAIVREYTQSSKTGRIKVEKFSATFVSGKKIFTKCSFKKNKIEEYKGYVVEKGHKIKVTPTSAQEDFKRLKIAYLQNKTYLG